MELRIRRNLKPNTKDINDFLLLSRHFCEKKNITNADKNLMTCLAADGRLHMSAIHFENGDLLCTHVHLADDVRARALYSVSIRIDMEDRRRHMVGIANRALHWSDILYYRESGNMIYDFGGISPDTEDPELKGITEFKTGFGGIPVVEYHYIKARTMLGKAAMCFTRRTNEDL
jgi:hypothetical protein